MSSSKASSRVFRQCYRTTRYMYFAVRDMAREHGWPTSTLVHWMMYRTAGELLARNPNDRLVYLGEGLVGEEASQFARDVEKGLANAEDLDLPW